MRIAGYGVYLATSLANPANADRIKAFCVREVPARLK
jgi:hypothetical protein